jgi:hypothetical protein
MARQELFTLTEIARTLGVERHRVDYVVSAYEVEPVRRVGIARLFDRTGLEQVKRSLLPLPSIHATNGSSHVR